MTVATRALSTLLKAGKPGAEAALRLDARRAGSGARALAKRAAEIAPVLDGQGRRNVYRSMWSSAASELGVEFEEWARGFFLLGGRVRVWHNQVPLDDPVTLRLAADKPLSFRLLADAGVPVVEHLEVGVDEVDAAMGFVNSCGRVVVKPATGSGGGLGVTCGVESADDFLRARLRAARWDSRLLLERHAEGDEHRVLILDGEVLDVLRRHPPRVVGDGRSTVAQLMAAENERRLAAAGSAGLWPVRPDLDSVLALRRAGLDFGSVPADGQVVAVKSAANENGPGDNETVVEHGPETAVSAVAALGLRLASVELVGGAVVEVNGTPGLHYHYQVADPSKARPVAVPILKTLLRENER